MSLGFDHVGANMFFVPMNIWQGAPKIAISLYISQRGLFQLSMVISLVEYYLF
jgi:hypothetical protein